MDKGCVDSAMMLSTVRTATWNITLEDIERLTCISV